MTDLRPLDPAQHGQAGYAPAPDHLWTRDRATVRVLLAEMSTALMLYPLAIGPDGPGGPATLVAVTGLEAGRNDCLGAGGRWRTGYVPAVVRAYPFALAGAAGEGLAFDHDSGLWRADPDPGRGEVRFFAPDGRPTPDALRIHRFVRAQARDRAATERAVAALDAAGLLVPWDVSPAGAARPVAGLKRVDADALAALPAERLAGLRASQALLLAHAQILSVPRLAVIAGLAASAAAQDTAGLGALVGIDLGDFDLDPG